MLKPKGLGQDTLIRLSCGGVRASRRGVLIFIFIFILPLYAISHTVENTSM